MTSFFKDGLVSALDVRLLKVTAQQAEDPKWH